MQPHWLGAPPKTPARFVVTVTADDAVVVALPLATEADEAAPLGASRDDDNRVDSAASAWIEGRELTLTDPTSETTP